MRSETSSKKENKPHNIQVFASSIRLTEIKITELREAQKNGKPPGPGDIPLELIELGGKQFVKRSTRLIQKCTNADEIPRTWKMSYLSTIY